MSAPGPVFDNDASPPSLVEAHTPAASPTTVDPDDLLPMTDTTPAFCEAVLDELQSPRHTAYTFPFLEPISRDDYPDYYSVIKNPMDFSTVRQQMQDGRYRGRDGQDTFIQDIELIFSNCYTYNVEDSDIVTMARKVERLFDDIKCRLLEV
mmetsp:Transcript_22658/g.31910  ORF Transcript_22658/g.31910 Transcript_22658/m.31910 type:complete len:151 (+) Transcript_22658:146-598(+)